MENNVKNPSSLNTILLWVTLGALTFVGGATISNMKTLAAIEGGQVTRTELDTRILEVKVVQTQQSLDIVGLRLKVQSLESKSP